MATGLRVGGAPVPPVEEELPMEAPMEEAPLPVEEPPMPRMTGVEKVNPVTVWYKTPDMGPFMCSNCKHFEDPDMCGIVDGPIDPNGLCNVFEPFDQMPEEMAMDVPPVEEEVPLEEPELPTEDMA